MIPGQSDDVWEQTKKLNASAIELPTLGFTFNQEPVKAESAAVNSVRGQYKNLEYATEIDFWAKWDEMNKKLKEAGIDKIQSELQKQLDEWKAKQSK